MWECDFVSGVWPTKAKCYRASPLVSSPQFAQAFTHWTETAWQLVELLNLYTCHNQKFIQDDLDDLVHPGWFLQYLLVAIAANWENSSESDKFLVNERDSECHEAVVSDSEVHKADEVSGVRLVGEIDDELDEDCEVHEANKWWWWAAED